VVVAAGITEETANCRCVDDDMPCRNEAYGACEPNDANGFCAWVDNGCPVRLTKPSDLSSGLGTAVSHSASHSPYSRVSAVHALMRISPASESNIPLIGKCWHQQEFLTLKPPADVFLDQIG
jgi:hypothetical protein